jgi:hypothetical protein
MATFMARLGGVRVAAVHAGPYDDKGEMQWINQSLRVPLCGDHINTA